jgi:C4-dicarboxylate-specific signal transduction histidine kinase
MHRRPAHQRSAKRASSLGRAHFVALFFISAVGVCLSAALSSTVPILDQPNDGLLEHTEVASGFREMLTDVAFETTAAPTVWGRYRWRIALLGTALILQSGLIIALLFEGRRRRKAESGSRQLLTELAQMERLAVAGELTASIAHEIRQPLTAIVAHGGAALRWLSRDPPQYEEVRKTLRKIVDEGHRAGDAIESVQALFSVGGTSNALVQVNDLIHKILALVIDEMKASNIDLTCRLASNPEPQVSGVAVQLLQTVLNLVMNAIEAMKTTVDTRRQLRIETEIEDEKNVVITVADTGPGIDTDNVEAIFVPFFTTKQQGMGLGLSICRSIIDAHGGRLEVNSDRGKGATLRIVLPYCGAQKA